MRIGPARVEANRNFTTKLWNAARFCEMNACETRDDFDPAHVTLTVNKWIIAETVAAARSVTQGIEQLRFNEAAQAAYQFVWSLFCDWYLELIKPVLNAGAAKERDETRATAAWVRDQILKLLHPFMPFVTEELWRVTAERPSMLVVAPWPAIETPTNVQARAEIDWLIDLVSGIRSVRTEMNVPAASKIDLVLSGASTQTRERLAYHREALTTLARLASAEISESIPAASAQFVIAEATAALPLGNVIDLAKERARLEKDILRAESEIARLDAKLNNAEFIARAPEGIIDEQKRRRADAELLAGRLREAVRRLG
jgi:valyl-tRNA synthetase